MIGYGVPRMEEDGTFAGLVGSCVDVTEERRAREILEVSRTRRIESLGVLAGGIAHEFNNLLTVIGGRIQLLLDRLSADEPACHDLQLIQRSAQRAAALTQQLLAFGRRQLLQPRLVDLNEFVQALSLGATVGGGGGSGGLCGSRGPCAGFMWTRASSSGPSSTSWRMPARRCRTAAGSCSRRPTRISTMPSCSPIPARRPGRTFASPFATAAPVSTKPRKAGFSSRSSPRSAACRAAG